MIVPSSAQPACADSSGFKPEPAPLTQQRDDRKAVARRFVNDYGSGTLRATIGEALAARVRYWNPTGVCRARPLNWLHAQRARLMTTSKSNNLTVMNLANARQCRVGVMDGCP